MPEYGGRIRGVGHPVSKKTSSVPHTKRDDLEDWKKMVGRLYKDVEHLKHIVQDKEKELDEAEGRPHQSGKDSCTFRKPEVRIGFLVLLYVYHNLYALQSIKQL